MGVRLRALGALLVCLGLTIGAWAPLNVTAAKPAPVTFTHEITVDPNRMNGEPDLAIADDGRQMFTSGPWGFSTTVSMAWKSEDAGAQWDFLHGSCPANPLRPFCSRGGGDTEIQLGTPAAPGQPQRTYFADLNGLDSISCAYSDNGGDTFNVTGGNVAGQICNVAAGNLPGSDRQWIAVWRAADNHTSSDKLYMVTDLGDTPPGSDTAYVSTDAGQTWSAACSEDCVGDASIKQGTRPGPLVINKVSGTLYEFMGTSDSGTIVNISCDGGQSWTTHRIASHLPTQSSIGTTADFVAGAIDSAGNLYSTWTVAPMDSGDVSNPAKQWQVYYAHSDGQTSSFGNCHNVLGATWSPYVKLNGAGGVAAGSGGVNFGVMPWITAGDPGRVDIAYYGSTQPLPFQPDVSDPSAGHEWYVHLAQTLDGLAAKPTFTDYTASETPMHEHSICFLGLSCLGTGDRNLADFFEVRPDPQGRAVIVFADDDNSQPGPPAAGFPGASVISVVEQAGGPGLFAHVNGGMVSAPPASLTQALGLENSINDPTGDAKLPAHQPAPGANVDAADITNLQATDDGQTLKLKFKVANLGGNPTNAIVNDAATAAAAEVHTSASWLVTWHYNNDLWFAAATVDSTGTMSYLAGKPTDVFSSSAPKALLYNQDLLNGVNTSVQGSVDTAHNLIEIDVPLSAIGGPAKAAVLHGLTGFTVDSQVPSTLPGISGPVALFDNIDQTAPMDYPIGFTSKVLGGTNPFTAAASGRAGVALGAALALAGLVLLLVPAGRLRRR